MLYIMIWVFVFLVSTLLFKQVAGSLSILKPNLNSIIYYYSLLISSFIGSLIIVLDIDNYYMINKLTHEEYRIIGFTVICFVMLFLPLMMMIVTKIAGFQAKQEFESYLNKPIAGIYQKKNEFFYIFLGISSLSILAIVYTIIKTPNIPIFELVKGSSNLAELRIDASRGFRGNVLLRNIFAIALTPLLSFIAYIFAEKTKQLKWFLLFLILFAGSVFINVYDLAKSPIFFYLIMFFLVRIYIGKTRLTIGKVLLLGGVGSIVLITMYVFIQGVSDIDQYLSYRSGPIGRLLLAQISPTFLHLNLFGEFVPFLNGQSLPSTIIGLFDVDQVRSARLVMEYYFPDRVADGTAGVLNTLFVGEAFANFGYVGIVLSTIYLGVLIQVLYIVFLRLPKNPILLSLFIYFSVNIPRTLVGGFSDFLFNPIWVFLSGLLIGILIVIRIRVDLTGYLKKVLKNS